MPIRVLPEVVAAQIAAGEVVERPASVVKELIENALDAGASIIGIEVRDGGQNLVRVSDDGAGIPGTDVALAFRRHSTSKLTSAQDLAAIETLGFRGEALASIAAVAKVTIVTRAKNEQSGTKVRIDGGELVTREAVGAPQGTAVAVESLFYNVPARLKFLRSIITEKRHINALVTRYAMAYPNVRFSLVHDGRSVFRSPGNGQLLDVLIAVFGLETAKQMLPIGDDQNMSPASSGEIKVVGYASTPGLNRANRSQITLFVNGRWIQDSGLTFAVTQAYHTMIMTGRYPVAVLLLSIDPAEVDVNVHPTKAEVRFRDKNAVFGEVQRAVRRVLVDTNPIRSAELSSGHASGGWTVSTLPPVPGRVGAPDPVPGFQTSLDLPGTMAGSRSEMIPPETQDQPGQFSTGARTLPMLRLIGQVGAAFIVAEGPAGLVVVDQHAAHERILYEKYMAERQQGVTTQTLLEPVPVDIPADRATLLESKLDLLENLGFIIEHFGGTTFMVRGLPAMLGEISPAAALEAVADDLLQGDSPLQHTIEEKIIIRVCKTAAVKAGQVLTTQEMVALIRQLESCASPHTCPHGRPTMIEMSSSHLAKQFDRT